MKPSYQFAMIAMLFAATSKADDKKSIEAIKKAGGEVEIVSGDTTKYNISFRQLDDKAATAMKDLKNIISLKVEDASKLTDKSMAIIGGMKNLRDLFLHKPAITNAGVAKLKPLSELKSIYLADCKINDTCIATFKDLSQLEELDLSGTAITNAAGANLGKISSLKSLSVAKTKFGDAGAAKLHDLKDLKELNAVNTDLSEKAAIAIEAAIKGIRVRR